MAALSMPSDPGRERRRRRALHLVRVLEVASRDAAREPTEDADSTRARETTSSG
jgi:hypothetical protein